jgi:hypothetical protein
MARPRAALPVKLFVGLLGADMDLLKRTRQLLRRRYGDTDLESDVRPFDYTDYYESEMGPDLQRWFLAFETLIAPERLVEIKHETNALEAELAEQLLDPLISRPVNIDPGYLELGKLVLATTKDASHRLYLGRGIHAEVTLQYRSQGWHALPWTYPDYAAADFHPYFDQVRERLKQQRSAAHEDSRSAS